jgi:hypothetical protein
MSRPRPSMREISVIALMSRADLKTLTDMALRQYYPPPFATTAALGLRWNRPGLVASPPGSPVVCYEELHQGENGYFRAGIEADPSCPAQAAVDVEVFATQAVVARDELTVSHGQAGRAQYRDAHLPAMGVAR